MLWWIAAAVAKTVIEMVREDLVLRSYESGGILKAASTNEASKKVMPKIIDAIDKVAARMSK
jgi:hypothetical protein